MTIVNVVFLLPSLLIAFVHFDCIFAHERDPPDKETLVLAQIVSVVDICYKTNGLGCF